MRSADFRVPPADRGWEAVLPAGPAIGVALALVVVARTAATRSGPCGPRVLASGAPTPASRHLR